MLPATVKLKAICLYITTINCKPHIVSKGKNWVMKEFGTEIGNEYQDMNKKERTWVRPLMEWMSPVDNKEGNTARFAKVSFD